MYQFNPNNYLMTQIMYRIHTYIKCESWKGQLQVGRLYTVIISMCIRRPGMKTRDTHTKSSKQFKLTLYFFVWADRAVLGNTETALPAKAKVCYF